MTKLKEGHVIEYRTVLGDRVVSVVSGPYTSATGHECVELRNGLPIRAELCKTIGFECPHCGRKYDEPMEKCASDDCPSAEMVSKQQAYQNGDYTIPAPPVNPAAWKEADWIAFIDRHGSWTVEVK